MAAYACSTGGKLQAESSKFRPGERLCVGRSRRNSYRSLIVAAIERSLPLQGLLAIARPAHRPPSIRSPSMTIADGERWQPGPKRSARPSMFELGARLLPPLRLLPGSLRRIRGGIPPPQLGAPKGNDPQFDRRSTQLPNNPTPQVKSEGRSHLLAWFGVVGSAVGTQRRALTVSRTARCSSA